MQDPNACTRLIHVAELFEALDGPGKRDEGMLAVVVAALANVKGASQDEFEREQAGRLIADIHRGVAAAVLQPGPRIRDLPEISRRSAAVVAGAQDACRSLGRAMAMVRAGESRDVEGTNVFTE